MWGNLPDGFPQVGFAAEAECVGKEREGAEEFPAGAVFVAGGVDGRVGEVSEERVFVGAAQAVNEFQVGAALTVEVVVEGAEGERIHDRADPQ
jgi:hypothetical protein